MSNEKTILYVGDKKNISARDKQRLEMCKSQGYEIVYHSDLPEEKMEVFLNEAHLLEEDKDAIIIDPQPKLTCGFEELVGRFRNSDFMMVKINNGSAPADQDSK